MYVPNCGTLATWNDDFNVLKLLNNFLDASPQKSFDKGYQIEYVC